MLANDLKLNDDKTDFFVVLSPHHLRQFSCPDILLSCHTFSTSTAVKNLGCYFYRHMNLDRLISSYCSTAYYHLRNISRVSHYLSREACHAAVRSLVLSRLDFSNGLLGGLNHGQVARLQLVQNSAARPIFHIRKRDHITPFLKQLHWLPIQMRIRFKLCTYMYKAIHNLGPSYINNAVHMYTPSRHLRSCDDGLLLAVYVPRKKLGYHDFTITGPQAWNLLPREIRSAPSMNSFKNKLKTHLFKIHNFVY